METLPQDILRLIFDLIQRWTQRAYSLRSVSKHWAKILSNRARYPPLLHHQVVLLPQCALSTFLLLVARHSHPRTVPQSETLHRLLSMQPMANERLDDPRAVRALGKICRNRTSLFLAETGIVTLYRVVSSPLVDVVLVSLTVHRPTYQQALAPNTPLRAICPLPTRVRLIVAVTDVDSLPDADREQEFVTLCSYFVSVLRLPAHLHPQFVPISLSTGDGIEDRASFAPWYPGPSLLDALALPSSAPWLPPSDAPLLLVLCDSGRLGNESDEAASEVWLRVFRRSIRAGCVTYRKDSPITITAVHTPHGVACEGSVVRVTYTGANLYLGDVLDEVGSAQRAYKTQLKCGLFLRELPQHCPLLAAGMEFTLRTHLGCANGGVEKLLAVVFDGKQKLRPAFAKAKSQVVCILTYQGGLWTMESSEGRTRSGFELLLLELEGKVIAHGRVLPEPSP